jgi:PPOX class probable F420-dependent enzyme
MQVGMDEAAQFFSKNHRAVVGTIARDGTPQMSNVAQAFIDGRIEISTPSKSAKARNLERDPRVTVLVLSEDSWYQYMVAYGTAEIIRMPEAGPRLRKVYEAISGPHPDWAEFDQAMIDQDRVVLSVSIDRVIR